MLKAVKTIGLALVLSALSSAGRVSAQQRDRLDPFMSEFEVVSYNQSTGDLTVKMTISYLYPEDTVPGPCDHLTLWLWAVSGLTYDGEDTVQIPFPAHSPYSILFEVTVPPNDTSCLVVLPVCGELARWDGVGFITAGDTLQTTREISSFAVAPSIEWTERRAEPYLQKDYERAKREWEAQQESLKILYPPEGTMTRGKATPEEAMLSKLRSLSPEDSALFITLSEKAKRRFLKMRNLERTPLADIERQIISLDGAIYVRYRGETKFHLVEGTTDPIAHAKKVMDSVRIAENKDYDITIDVRDPDDLEFVKKLIDKLMPTDQQGFFRAVLKWETIMELRDNGIEFFPTDRKERDSADDSEPQQPEEREESSGSSGTRRPSGHKSPQEVMFYEGFEGAFPGILWWVQDSDPLHGYDYWDNVTCRPGSGSLSAWCSGGGNMPKCQYYDWYMDTYMAMNYGVNLENPVTHSSAVRSLVSGR